jgi:DNA-directed RNA polymerase specialized sigma24 family protein
MAEKAVDQRFLDRYQNDYYVHTDQIYRFAVVLTGSREGAERVTEEAFRRLLENFERSKPHPNPLEQLLSLAWKSWNTLSTSVFHPWSQATISSLGKLTIDERSALYVVDVAGFSPQVAAKITETSEASLRLALAAARKHLVAGEISL